MPLKNSDKNKNLIEDPLFFANLVQTSDDAIEVLSVDGKVIFWNKAAENLYGYTAKEMLQETLLKIYPKTNVAELQSFMALLKNGEHIKSFVTHRIKKDNTLIEVVVSATPILNGKNVVIASSIISRPFLGQEQILQYTRSLIEASLDPMVAISAEGKITDVNKATIQITGVSREKLIGSNFLDYFTEPAKAKEGYQQAFIEGYVRDYPLSIKHVSGVVTDVLYNASIYKNSAGTVLGVFATARDVSTQKQASQYARSLIEASLDPLVTINIDGKITDVNQATIEVTGVSRNRMIGSDFSDYFTDPDEAREGYKHTFEEGYVRDYPLSIRHVNGKITHVLYNATIYKNAEGRVLGVFAAARDITQRKKIEEQLHITSAYARSLIESSLDPLMTISPEGKITDVNHASVSITGVTREWLIGSDFMNYFTEPHKAREANRLTLKNGSIRNYPLSIRHTSGVVVDVLYNATVFRDAQGVIQGIFAAARDITDRKLAENQLKETLNQLEESNKELKLFAHVTSHELQEPLRMISSFSQLIEKRYKGKLDKEANEFIDYLVKGSTRIQNLLNDLLMYLSISSTVRPYVEIDVNEMIKKILFNLDEKIKEMKAEVTYDSIPVVWGEVGRLDIVL
jgi:PAS domain S-box-containing protein